MPLIEQVERKTDYRCLACGSYVAPRRSGGQRAWDCPNRACVRYSATQILPRERLPDWVEFDRVEAMTQALRPDIERVTKPILVIGLFVVGVLVMICAVVLAQWFGVRLR